MDLVIQRKSYMVNPIPITNTSPNLKPNLNPNPSNKLFWLRQPEQKPLRILKLLPQSESLVIILVILGSNVMCIHRRAEIHMKNYERLHGFYVSS